MRCHKIVFYLLYMSSVSGLILPITKTDGTLDVSSLLSHISLMEQSIEDKASAADMARLMSELAETKTKLTQVETKLDTTTDDLKAAKDDLKKAEMEIAVLKNQLSSRSNMSNQGGSQTSPGSTYLTDVSSLKADISSLKTDIPSLKADVSSLKADVPSLKSNFTHVKTDVSHLQTEVAQLKSQVSKPNTGGPLFTRWGRTSCPADSNIVYKGYTGGTHEADTASAASILCLPDQPIYANHTDAAHDIANHWGSHIFGTEYQAYTNEPGFPFRHLLDEDMPCAVCESRSSSNVLMIPARNQCYPGWTLEYSGYLMGPSYQLASGEYICVDSDAETIPGGEGDKRGQQLYPVEGRCGSLPCPPYHDHWELTCVVCSK